MRLLLPLQQQQRQPAICQATKKATQPDVRRQILTPNQPNLSSQRRSLSLDSLLPTMTRLRLIVIEPPERPLGLTEFLFGLRDRVLQFRKTDVVAQLITRARLVLVGAEVLDLLARVFDLCQAERRAAAFEEVAEGRELG